MKEIVRCIEELRMKLDRHRKEDLKEYPTRTIFIDPLLQALGWDVRDPDEVELEYPTIDGRSVDYSPKLNRRPVLFIEAKPLNDSLTDVKSITQVVGYAANAGVDWCILTNGVAYKVYRSTEKAEAPDKLLFEVSIDPKESRGGSLEQIAEQFDRFSRDAMARGVLDEIGEKVFTTGKIQKALDRLFLDPPAALVRIIRSATGDESIKPTQVKAALKRLLSVPEVPVTGPTSKAIGGLQTQHRAGRHYGEDHHIKAKPPEVVELFRAVDEFCTGLGPGTVEKKYLKKYVSYRRGKSIFCSVHVQKRGLRVWLKLNYSLLENPPDYVRDVSSIGHWGVGDVEMGVDGVEKLQISKSLIKQSFEENK